MPQSGRYLGLKSSPGKPGAGISSRSEPACIPCWSHPCSLHRAHHHQDGDCGTQPGSGHPPLRSSRQA